MKMLFDERGHLVATTYYQSPEYAAGKPCCVVREGVWHLMLPDRCPALPEGRHAYAVPVVAKSEPEGWTWKLLIRPRWTMRLPCSCFIYPAPELPGFGEEYRQAIVMYGLWLPGLIPSPLSEVSWETNEVPQPFFSATLAITRITAMEKLARGGKLPETYK